LTDARSPRIATAEPHRYLALDALRGVAALVVVTLHARNGFAGLPDPRSGYLAVDLFFLLSGFVIASAYDARLDAALTWRAFLVVRLIRLYPLYLLGMSVGIATALLRMFAGAPPPEPGRVALDVLFGLAMLPSPTTIGTRSASLFPLDPPAWSLFYELAVNIAFALGHRHLSRTMLRNAILVLALTMAGVALGHGSVDVGNYWVNILQGFPRAALPFLVGVYLFRYGRRIAPGTGAALAGAIAALVAVLMLDPGRWRVPFDLATVCVLFPLLVAVSARMSLSARAGRLAGQAGKVSYAVYIVHGPAIGLLYAVLRRVAPQAHEDRLAGPAVLVLAVLGCWAVDRYYDVPLRRWLSRRARPAA